MSFNLSQRLDTWLIYWLHVDEPTTDFIAELQNQMLEGQRPSQMLSRATSSEICEYNTTHPYIVFETD